MSADAITPPSGGSQTQNVSNVSRGPWKRPENSNLGSGSGGGSGGDGMLQRVEALEEGMNEIKAVLKELRAGQQTAELAAAKASGEINTRLASIDAKLDAKATKADLTPIETKLATIREVVDTRAATSDLNLVKGRVENLPTTIQLFLFAIAIFTAAGITRFFAH